MTLGSDGNLFGVCDQGGTAYYGVALEITPSGAETILHTFSGMPDGTYPVCLTRGNDGDFYGTTVGGGSTAPGDGTVFKITPSGTETIVHDFGTDKAINPNGGNATNPNALILGSDGSFYGTTFFGGVNGTGTAFKITPTGTLTVLHNFGPYPSGGVNTDGIYPVSALCEGSDGSFYGTTSRGGSSGYGTVFKVTAAGVFTLLHTFLDGTVNNDGVEPTSGLVLGSDGNFYGTTRSGGSTGVPGTKSGYGYGTIYKVTPSGAVTILHSFGDGTVPNDGASPTTGLTVGSDGNLYGTTTDGGSTTASDPSSYGYGGYGTVFKLTLPSAPPKPILYSFSPASGPVGTIVTITGVGLANTTVVGFQGQHAKTFTVVSDTQITAVVPAGAATGPVALLAGGVEAKSATDFTVIPPAPRPTITGFTPGSGPVGTTVTITGTNLTDTTVVGFQGKHAASFTVNSAGTQITTTVPVGAATGPVAVLANGIEVKSGTNFAVTP